MNSGEQNNLAMVWYHLIMGCIPLYIKKTPWQVQWMSISLLLGTLATRTPFAKDVAQLVVIDNCLLISVQCSRGTGRLCGHK